MIEASRSSTKPQVLFSLLSIAISLLGIQTVAQVSSSPTKERAMSYQANGTFDVKITPQKADNKEAESAGLGRMSIHKQFHGDLDATSDGEMLTVGSSASSGGYVAIEKVSGTLKGRTGTFALQHNGMMDHGEPKLSIAVVPGSGTGDLTGLSGVFNIKITEGKHFYEFEYTLSDPQK